MPLRGDSRKRSKRSQPRDGRASAPNGDLPDLIHPSASTAVAGASATTDRRGRTTLFVVVAAFGILWWLGRRGRSSPNPPLSTAEPAETGLGDQRPLVTGTTPERDLPADGRLDSSGKPSPNRPVAPAGGTGGPTAGPATDDPAGHVVGRYGPGSADPPPDGAAPSGFPIKGNGTSKVYHAPESPYYARTRADVWFHTTDAAEAAGFRHWNSRRRRG